MEENNKIYIDREKIEQIIKSRLHAYDNIECETKFEYFCEYDFNSSNLIKITEKFCIKDLENTRTITLDEEDLKEIITIYLHETNYCIGNLYYECKTETDDKKIFKGIQIYLNKKQEKRLIK